MNHNDQNFDSHSKTFGKNIYGTIKGKIREAVLMRDLTDYLSTIPNNRKLNILDVGGGQGQVSLQLAKLGHHVVINDVSEQMLAQAKATSAELSIENVEFVHCPLQHLITTISAETGEIQQFDIVLCHAVFEWLEDPESAFNILNQLTKDNGMLSLMFYNKVGQTLSNLVYGNFDYIDAGMKGKKVVKLNPQSSLEPSNVYRWVEQHNRVITTKSGVRCFNDYMRDISMWQNKQTEIIEKELEYSQLSPYSDIGRYMHLIIE